MMALLELPACSDTPRVSAAIEMISALSSSCWVASKSNLLAFLYLRSIDLTLAHGLVLASPFALYG